MGAGCYYGCEFASALPYRFVEPNPDSWGLDLSDRHDEKGVADEFGDIGIVANYFVTQYVRFLETGLLKYSQYVVACTFGNVDHRFTVTASADKDQIFHSIVN